MKKLLLIALIFAFSFSPFLMADVQNSSSVMGQNSQKYVTVGYVVKEVDYENSASGFRKKGYEYEYIQKLISYTGWKCNYVYGTWNEIYDKLVSGKIDMMPSVVRTDERRSILEFPNFAMGQENYVIFTKADRLSSDPRNYDVLNGFKIGVINETVHESVLQHWIDSSGIDIKIIRFDDEKKRLNSFKANEIDGFVDLDFISDNNVYPAVYLGERDVYFAFAKGRKELCQELNAAMASLLYQNPYFNSNLWNKYYSNIFAQKELLDDEKEWLLKSGNVRIGVMEEDFPYCYRDKNGKAAGYVVDLLDFTKKYFGISELDFSFKFYGNYQKLLDDLKTDEIQLAFPVYMSLEQAENQDYILSDTACSVPMSYICNNSSNELSENVAIAFSRLGPSYMQDFYPETNLTLYETRKNCLEAVLDRQSDGAVINTIKVENYLHKSRKYRSLKIVNLPHSCDIGFAVTRKNLTLLGFVNRGIYSIGSDEKAKSITYHSMQNSNYMIKDFLADYLEVFVFLLIFIFLLVLLLVISLDKLRGYLNYDSLTRLLNRRTLNTYLENAKRKADDKGDPFCLLMLDIDDFKHVNDVYGHVCGDEVLKSVAKTIMHAVSTNDYIFRWGGEEILVLVNAEKNVARKIAERIRNAIENLTVDYKSNQINVTVTIGIAVYETGNSIKSLFESADEKMYEGKKSGKNVVIC